MQLNNDNGADLMARRKYKIALQRASRHNLGNKLRRGCNDLLPYSRVSKQLQHQAWRNIGVQSVAIDAIVGSSGHHRDFDLAFLPRRKETDDRWVNIARAHNKGTGLPPVTLYKVGDAYFVEDGNHRVSVARMSGQEFVRAIVIEVDSSTLTSESSCTRLGFKV